jgi:hypothetical protein
MTLRCPECGTEFDGAGLAGRPLVHCPTCGRGIPRSDAGGEEAAAFGPARTSGLAVLSLVAGVGSLVAPICLCLPGFFLLAGTVAGPVMTRPAAMVAPVPPTATATVTLPDGSTIVIDPATGQPVTPPVPVPTPPVPAPPGAGGGEDESGPGGE